MTKTEEIRTVVQFLMLEGLEISTNTVQHMLNEKGIDATEREIEPIIQAEGGPLSKLT